MDALSYHKPIFVALDLFRKNDAIMKKLLFSSLLLIILNQTFANKILVENLEKLSKANAAAQPGDTIVLKNGNWSNCILKLTCNGTEKQPIVFKAEKAGEVLITGESSLRISGSYLVVDGLNFTNGYAPDGSVWEFRAGKEVGNNCRITNCAINSFNAPKRLKENYWVSFYGKHNRIDHCTFFNKTNIGVLIGVILDDERSRQNFHSIDSNYFAMRIPLASNAGEIIRVGVSQHCTFYSNTIIRNNLFERCNGEVEIISIKSCGNFIKNNVFRECQGGLSLRHGNNNTVEGNIFLGNNKEGTGGARIINEGNWVVNNLFYNCRGVNFRSPLAIMNGVPNSPAFRYLPVRDAVVANNTFINCTPFSLCEGSDKERSKPPVNVYIFKNVFANNRDSILYYVFDKTDSIYLANNLVSNTIQQSLMYGFEKKAISLNLLENAPLLVSNPKNILPDSILKQASYRLPGGFPKTAGFTGWNTFKKALANPYLGMGNKWQSRESLTSKREMPTKTITNCATADEVYKALAAGKYNVSIILTGKTYHFSTPIIAPAIFSISQSNKQPISISSSNNMAAVFIVQGGSSAFFRGLTIDLTKSKATSFISLDTSGSSSHQNVVINNCSINNLSTTNFFTAPKYSVADSIVVGNCSFTNNNCNLFALQNELDNIGYYNVERMKVTGCTFENNNGFILNLYRGGHDESTMGPNLSFINNKILNCNGDNELLRIYGVQISTIKNNSFTNCNTGKVLISYTDIVRAAHLLEGNKIANCGVIKTNEFVSER